MAYSKKIDVVYIQELWSLPKNKTQNHLGYKYYCLTNL
jgi:hypothetical protein